eukprot:m.17883 g.17883  ORF g.17883 m.17883 type:complete len:119 (-) comp29726_c0_seq1:532-888(-)
MCYADGRKSNVLGDANQCFSQFDSYERLAKYWTSPASVGVRLNLFSNQYKTLTFLSELDPPRTLHVVAVESELSRSESKGRLLNVMYPHSTGAYDAGWNVQCFMEDDNIILADASRDI